MMNERKDGLWWESKARGKRVLGGCGQTKDERGIEMDGCYERMGVHRKCNLNVFVWGLMK